MAIRFGKRSVARVILLTSLLVACRADDLGDKRAEATFSSGLPEISGQPLPDPYPPGAWRSTPAAELKCVVVWLSHILVRHDASRNASVSFDHAHWTPSGAPPTRSREAALHFANDIAQRAQQNPSQFASLARQYSEDQTTRDRDGALGGVAADQLRAWPMVLDAMSALRPGEVSRVVETAFGFHILLRSAPPAETEASGAHIVIAHDDARWIRFVARGSVPKRTRAEAWDLANSIYERARAAPASFAQLVQEHSNHRDAARGGDFGTWSNHAPTPFPREIQALQNLEVGQIARPLDTRVGIQIIQRRANMPRTQYAMTALHLPFQADAPQRMSARERR